MYHTRGELADIFLVDIFLHLKQKKLKCFFVVMYKASSNKAIKYQTCIN